MIIIDIKNALEVAANEAFMGQTLCRLAPNMIRRKVEEQVAISIREVFQKRGIDADIMVRLDDKKKFLF